MYGNIASSGQNLRCRAKLASRSRLNTACTSCTLTLTSDRVDTVISAGGYRYTPALGGATVQICPA